MPYCTTEFFFLLFFLSFDVVPVLYTTKLPQTAHIRASRAHCNDNAPNQTPLTLPLSEHNLICFTNIATPIISAPMAFASTPELAAAVTGAGGFGSIGACKEPSRRVESTAGYYSSQVLKEQVQKIRTGLNIPTGEPVPIAIGFLGRILDRTETSDDLHLIAVLDKMPAAVWFAFGVDLEKYVDQFHASVEDTRRAALKGVDAVVVQGTEAGGHGVTDVPPLFVLLQAVLREFQTNDGPLVVAAGDVSTEAHSASLLTMGADDVVLGTRFLFTPECEYTDAQKQVLIKADLTATVHTMAFDVSRSNGWPPNCNGRAISNEIMDDYKAELTLDERLEKFDESARDGDESRLVVWAVVGAGPTNEIKGPADVLRELHEETIEQLNRAIELLA
ncbi:Nitronate monooxygenase [Mycena venus]|uniref:Nitronate monooxygenase n=1 Tax=Mycena venus TaxID=2733690 RepID=A0A8H6X3Z0_9AGAR|nr:Nitronate monooxygenase [Mycena venus]